MLAWYWHFTKTWNWLNSVETLHWEKHIINWCWYYTQQHELFRNMPVWKSLARGLKYINYIYKRLSITDYLQRGMRWHICVQYLLVLLRGNITWPINPPAPSNGNGSPCSPFTKLTDIFFTSFLTGSDERRCLHPAAWGTALNHWPKLSLRICSWTPCGISAV